MFTGLEHVLVDGEDLLLQGHYRAGQPSLPTLRGKVYLLETSGCVLVHVVAAISSIPINPKSGASWLYKYESGRATPNTSRYLWKIGGGALSLTLRDRSILNKID
jgi:hypothetical protein